METKVFEYTAIVFLTKEIRVFASTETEAKERVAEVILNETEDSWLIEDSFLVRSKEILVS